MQIKIPQATAKQCNFIEQLSVDLGFDRTRRNAHISSIVGRPIKYIDELTLGDASNVITIFLEWKDNRS